MTRPRESPVMRSPESMSQHASSKSRSSYEASPRQNQGIMHRRLTDDGKEPDIPSEVSEVAQTPIGSAVTERIYENSPIFAWDKDAVYRRSSRYYGPTSFSAVFNEGAKL